MKLKASNCAIVGLYVAFTATAAWGVRSCFEAVTLSCCALADTTPPARFLCPTPGSQYGVFCEPVITSSSIRTAHAVTPQKYTWSSLREASSNKCSWINFRCINGKCVAVGPTQYSTCTAYVVAGEPCDPTP